MADATLEPTDILTGAQKDLEIVGYKRKFAGDFAVLNYQWIEEFFAVEAEDRAALDFPERYAIDRGGQIFFILDCSGGAEKVIGTAAMVPKKHAVKSTATSPHKFPISDPVEVFELAKMAVSPQRQGEGLGKWLLQHCIAYAVERGAKQVILTTNDVLKPALAVYHGLGFVDLPVNPDERYERGNLAMTLDLDIHSG
jgi:GNAT superfamily N-acetyltransferase